MGPNPDPKESRFCGQRLPKLSQLSLKGDLGIVGGRSNLVRASPPAPNSSSGASHLCIGVKAAATRPLGMQSRRAVVLRDVQLTFPSIRESGY
jgi:hypothetical protein